MRVARHHLVGLTIAAACRGDASTDGTEGASTSTADPSASAGASTTADITPPCVDAAAPRGPHTVYLAFDGLTLHPAAGGDDDAVQRRTRFVASTTTYAPFWADEPGRAAKIAAVIADLDAIFAAFEVEFTADAPTGDHQLVVLAGDDAGALLGLTHHDCGDEIRNDVAILFAGAADPARGAHAVANDVAFALTRAIGLPKTSGPGHPCSCDSSGVCDPADRCVLAPAAEVFFSSCPGDPAVVDELAAFAAVYGCTP